MNNIFSIEVLLHVYINTLPFKNLSEHTPILKTRNRHKCPSGGTNYSSSQMKYDPCSDSHNLSTCISIIPPRSNFILACTGCSSEPLIAGRKPVKNSQLTATSSQFASRGPSRSRLKTQAAPSLSGGWVAKINDKRQYIQVYRITLQTPRQPCIEGRPAPPL